MRYERFREIPLTSDQQRRKILRRSTERAKYALAECARRYRSLLKHVRQQHSAKQGFTGGLFRTDKPL